MCSPIGCCPADLIPCSGHGHLCLLAKRKMPAGLCSNPQPRSDEFGLSLPTSDPLASPLLILAQPCRWWKQRDKYIFGDLKRVRHKQVLFFCPSAQLGWIDTGNILLILWANPFRRMSNPSKHGAHHNTSQCATLSNHDSLLYYIKIGFFSVIAFYHFFFFLRFSFWEKNPVWFKRLQRAQVHIYGGTFSPFRTLEIF